MMPQFKVPQNLDMEDRIIGKLTISQFGYLAFGGLVAYVALIKLPGVFGIIIAIPVALIAFAFTFVRVQDQPFSKFVTSLISYIGNPRDRTWRRDETTPADTGLITADKQAKKVEKKATKKVYSAADIRKLAETVDSHGYTEVDDARE